MRQRKSFLKGTVYCVFALSILLSPAMGFGATFDVYPTGENIIQDTIDKASAGDTIIVHAGNYTENIVVQKQLTIKKAGDGDVHVYAKKGSDPCIIVKSSGSGSTIQGFILSDATSDDGIHLDNADNCLVNDNNIWNNGHYGIHSTGSGNTISANYISNNGKDGILSEKSSQTPPTTISGNTIEGNGNYGIHSKQDYNTITGNNISHSGEDGVYSEGSYNNISNNHITNNGDFGIHSTGSGNTISKNTISSNGTSHGKDGIYSEKSSQTAPTTITGNTIEGSGKYGIHSKQDYNTITGNNIRDNGDHGVYSEGSYNKISGNTLKNTKTIGNDAIHIKGDNNTLSDNTIDNFQGNGIYILGKQNKIFGTSQYTQSISNCAQGIRLTTGDSPFQSEDTNEVYNNVLQKNTDGIHVLLSSFNEIHDNRIIDHHQGIYLRDSALNDIYGNTVKLNKEFGINIEQFFDCRWKSEKNLVHNNTIAECILSGISLLNINLFKEQNLNNIYENHISLCATGINSLRDNASQIHDNTIKAVGVGIALELSKDSTIFQNRISVDLIGILFFNSSSDDVSFNRITSIADALVNGGGSPGNVNAENNWWGSNDDPGSKIKGTVDYTPWLVLKADANPEKIYDTGPLNKSTITADLCHDSSGNYHDPTNRHVPNGIPVFFWNLNIPSVGNLDPNESPTSNGSATSTFTATGSGDADITAAVDRQTVHTSVTIEALSFLSITKTESSDPVMAGKDIIYTIKAHNKGPNKAENVQLTDVIPSHLNNVRYSTLSDSGPWKKWPPASGYVDLGNLLVNHDTNVWMIGSVDPATPNGTLLKNTSSVTSTTDPSGPVSTSINTTVRTVASVGLEKTVDKAKPNVGDRITFTVTAINNGPSEAQGFVLNDIMPSAFASVAITPSKGTYNNGVWTIPSLTVGEQATLTLQGTVTQEMECKTYTNTATTKYPNAPKKVVNASISVVCPAPTIESFSPTSGSIGTTVEIIGTNFTGTQVKFGGTDAARFTVDSTTQITAVVWTGSTGNVTVTTDEGTATSASIFTYDTSATLATGNPSSYKVTVITVEMGNGTSWVTIFSGTAQLDMVAGGTFPGISDLNLPAGTYSQVRVTFRNSFPVAGTVSYSGAPYYTTATAFFGQSNVASSPTTVAGSMAEFTFYNPAWGSLNADVTQTYAITPITVGAATDYQPTLRFTISNTLLLKGTAGNTSSYFFSLNAPTGGLVEP